MSLNGAGEWDLNHDQLITNQLLYQLSYAGPRAGSASAARYRSRGNSHDDEPTGSGPLSTGLGRVVRRRLIADLARGLLRIEKRAPVRLSRPVHPH